MTVPGAEDLLRELAPQVLGALVRRHGQFDGCEDAVQEALLAASGQWPAEGVPDNPRGWLVTVASRRFVDQVRSERARRERESATAPETVPEDVPDTDDTLVLLFLCCHPALTAASQTALTLRAVGGLTTAEIARAFLVPEATMAVRISRAKQRIKAAGSSFSLPAGAEREQRLQVVLQVLYLIFNEGYTASAGPDLHRADLAREAIRLTRMVARQLPGDSEVTGLLALMLLTHARRGARTTAAGDLVPLDEQDRTRWDHGLIGEGTELVKASLAVPALGPYQLQAAIAATHAGAATAAETNWAQVHALYLILERIAPNPVVTLNRAIALAQTQGPQAGLDLLSALDGDDRMAGHHRLLSVRAHLLEQAGDPAAAYEHYRRAARSTASLAEQRYLESRASRLRSQAQPPQSGNALDGGDAAVGLTGTGHLRGYPGRCRAWFCTCSSVPLLPDDEEAPVDWDWVYETGCEPSLRGTRGSGSAWPASGASPLTRAPRATAATRTLQRALRRCCSRTPRPSTTSATPMTASW
jgi:RNA polymerase sigma factor (sigma-70 family)